VMGKALAGRLVTRKVTNLHRTGMQEVSHKATDHTARVVSDVRQVL
jgi:hypothetical protein